ncbi:MAG: hybrid sensor histidine kinase/response regulator [Thermodesulfovibrionales bacterium]
MADRLNVLLILDSPDDEELIRIEFKRKGMDCHVFTVNDEDGMKNALTKHWDVIISDYALPKISCSNALSLIRDNYNLDIPFIVVSSPIGEDLAVSVMRAGANDYISKENLNRLIPAVLREIEAARVRQQKSLAEDELRRKNKELNEINNTLQERVNKEVAKTREKDLLIEKQARFMLITDIMSRIAHQWRQPLNAVALILQEMETLLPENPSVQSIVKKRIEIGMEKISHLSSIIDRFYNFFLPDTQKLRFNVIDSIKNAINLIESTLKEAGITLITNFQDNNLYVYGFYKEYSHVILNILNNSYDAIISRKVKLPYISITTSLDKDVVKTIIKDNAGGIESSVIDRIFEPYFTTKFESEGVGLGLYISKIMIEKNMGGRIVASNTTEGAILEISLKNVE